MRLSVYDMRAHEISIDLPLPQLFCKYFAAGKQVKTFDDYELVGGNLPQGALGNSFFRAMPEIEKP